MLVDVSNFKLILYFDSSLLLALIKCVPVGTNKLKTCEYLEDGGMSTIISSNMHQIQVQIGELHPQVLGRLWRRVKNYDSFHS